MSKTCTHSRIQFNIEIFVHKVIAMCASTHTAIMLKSKNKAALCKNNQNKK